MSNILRRLRGAFGLGLLWGAGGALVGGLIELAMNILPGSDLFLGVDMWPAALAIPGFILGVTFSGVLWLVEGRRGFEELKVPRLALLGAVGGVALGALVGLPLGGIAALALYGGASAAGSLALARRGRALEQISRGDDPETG